MTVENHEADGIVSRSLGMSVRAVRKKEREVDFIASTEAVDSYDEIVEQSWQLDRFKGNPVILFAHKSRELPIGRATRCEVVKGALECTIRFASAEANPVAEQVWRLVEEECLNAVSVGFYPRTVRHEKRDGKDVYVLADNELHEISVVPVPANPEALAKMKAKARAEARTQQQSGDTPRKEDAEMMTPEEQAQFNKAKEQADTFGTAHRAAEVKVVELTKSNEALSLQAKTLTEQRDAAAARAEKAEGDVLEKEVDALVGVKITPAQKPDFLKMAKLDRTLFDNMVKGLPATGVTAQLGAQSVLPTEKAPLENVATKAADDTGADVVAEATRLGNGA